MKRAIFHKLSIDVCIERGILCTPISPETLPFDIGEEMVVATPKSQAPVEGEYQLLFTMGEYIGDRPDLGDDLFQRSDWRHAYRVVGIARIDPFSLDQVVAAAGDRRKRFVTGTRVKRSTTGSSGRSSRSMKLFGDHSSLSAASRLPRQSRWLQGTKRLASSAELANCLARIS